MDDIRLAVFGCGFWARFQIAAWRELPGARIVALYNRTRSKAEALAAAFGIPAVYDDPEALLANERLDAIDIITDVDTHPRFVKLAAAHRIPAICQKPMAPSLAAAEDMLATCRAAGVPLIIHENWRWQAPLRALKQQLDEGRIGEPFRARIEFISGFPVFANQPALAELEQFVITDIGSHILDAARFLFGEVRTLYCTTHKVHRTIRGEDVATVVLTTERGATVICALAYAENYLERDRFPETSVFVEAERGSLELGPDYWLRLTTAEGTLIRRCPPPRYAWADPAYEVVHASIVPCNRDILRALRGGPPAETSAEDNIKTVRLYFGAYDSAARGQALVFD